MLRRNKRSENPALNLLKGKDMQTATIGKVFGKRLSRFLLFGMIILPGIACAASSAIEGIVKDPRGRPISGADVRIEARNQNSSRVVKSDAKGHYVYGGVTAGATYRVTLLVNGAVKASINNVQVKPGEPTQLNFDLKTASPNQTSTSAKKGKHMVWMPAQTGTNIGGRWVEVDDSAAAGASGPERIEKASGAALRNFQSNTGTVRGGN
jgi:hypothetical protein